MSQLERRLDQCPVTRLKGVGSRLADKLAKLELHSLQDLLFHLPRRYLDRTRITPIGALRPGDDAVLEGEIRAADIVYGRRRSLVCRLQDGTGTLSLRFFHFSAAQRQSLSPGTRVRCFGECRPGASGLELYHPEYQVLDERRPQPLEQALTPVYPTTEGLSQARLRRLVAQAMEWLDERGLPELLPEGLRRELDQVPLVQALRYLHAPPPDANLAQLLEGEHPYQRRLALEELLAHHLSLMLLRRERQAETAPALLPEPDLQERFLARLSFQLTSAQQRVSAEIGRDLGMHEKAVRQAKYRVLCRLRDEIADA